MTTTIDKAGRVVIPAKVRAVAVPRTDGEARWSFRNAGWRLAAAAVSPFALISAYLFLSRWPSYHFTTLSDFLGLGLPVFIGAAFALRLHVLVHRGGVP